MSAWRLIIDGKVHDFTNCTTCNMRRFAHKLLGDRGGEVEVQLRTPTGEYRKLMTFTVPRREDARSRPNSAEGQRSSVRHLPAGVYSPQRGDQRGSGELGRSRRGRLSYMLGQPREPKIDRTR